LQKYKLINYLVGVLISSTIMRLHWISSRLDKNGIWIPAANIIGKLEKVRAVLERTAPLGAICSDHTEAAVTCFREVHSWFLRQCGLTKPMVSYSPVTDTVVTYNLVVTICTGFQKVKNW